MKLAAKLPEGESNGLGALTSAMCHRPEDQHLIVALVDCSTLTTDIDTGNVIPTARIVAVEAITNGDGPAVQQALRDARLARTASGTLPLNVDPDTGEIT